VWQIRRDMRADRLSMDNYQSRKGNRLLMRPPRCNLSIKIVSNDARVSRACARMRTARSPRSLISRRNVALGKNGFSTTENLSFWGSAVPHVEITDKQKETRRRCARNARCKIIYSRLRRSPSRRSGTSAIHSARIAYRGKEAARQIEVNQKGAKKGCAAAGTREGKGRDSIALGSFVR